MKLRQLLPRFPGMLLPRLVLSLLLALLCQGIAGAQIPDTFENLQVLPKDIEKRQLIGLMKSYTQALGVRCQHCHIGVEGQPLSSFDFVSDEKEAKKTARLMMRMTAEINSKFITKLSNDGASPIEVRCLTCHHAQARPRTLAETLEEALEEKGLEAALERYQELRQTYYGSGTFDFSDDALVGLAEQLMETGKNPAAIAFLERNAELYPDSLMTHYFLGELYGQTDEKAKAVASYRRALELEPGNPRIEKKIEELSGGGS